MSRIRNSSAAIAAFILATAPATADAASDAVGDFLPSFTGPTNGDLDLIYADASLGAGDVTFEARVDGTFGATSGSFVAFGVNRGAGTPGLFQVNDPKIGAHALHDAVVLLRPDLTGTVVLIGGGGALTFTNLTAGSVSVAGGTVTGVVALSLLPTNGFAARDYTYVAWTRSAPGSNAFVADFAPDDTTFRAVPEPSTWAVMILGFGLAGATTRRRRAGATA